MFVRRTRHLGGALALVALAATACVDNRQPSPPETGTFAVEVQAVPLDALDPAKVSVGRLAYRGGLWLRSADPRFGGLSDLRISPDGKSFQAISDCGAVFEAGLAYDERGFLSGLRAPRLDPLLGPGGRSLARSEIDAEALATDGRDGFIVSFEGRHHLWHYPAPAGLRGNPTPLPAPEGLAACEPNAGAEAMARFPDGRLLLISEGAARGKPRTTPGWIGEGSTWSTFSYPLVYDQGIPQPFHPTSATTLPGSEDVLVLERRYPPVAARIRRVQRGAFEGGVGLAGNEVARFDPPLTLDNFEGIEAALGPHGETLVFVVSDDNNCAKSPGDPRQSSQRTLLLLFELSSN